MTTVVNAGNGSTTITTLGTITTGTWNGTVSVTGGGTGANIAASNGGIVYSTASTLALLSNTASAARMLQSGANAAPAWSTVTYPLTITAAKILYASTSSTISSIGTSIASLFCSAAAGPATVALNVADGNTVVGSASALPVRAALSAGAGLVINPALIPTVSFSLAAPTNEASTTVALTAGTFYLANAATLITFTLAASPTAGDTYVIVGIGAGGWKVAQNASQLIELPTGITTTTGTGGSLSSNNRYDCVTITYSETSNTFVATNIVGNIIYV